MINNRAIFIFAHLGGLLFAIGFSACNASHDSNLDVKVSAIVEGIPAGTVSAPSLKQVTSRLREVPYSNPELAGLLENAYQTYSEANSANTSIDVVMPKLVNLYFDAAEVSIHYPQTFKSFIRSLNTMIDLSDVAAVSTGREGLGGLILKCQEKYPQDADCFEYGAYSYDWLSATSLGTAELAMKKCLAIDKNRSRCKAYLDTLNRLVGAPKCTRAGLNKSIRLALQVRTNPSAKPLMAGSWPLADVLEGAMGTGDTGVRARLSTEGILALRRAALAQPGDANLVLTRSGSVVERIDLDPSVPRREFDGAALRIDSICTEKN